MSDSPSTQEAYLTQQGPSQDARSVTRQKTLALSIVISAFNEEGVLRDCLDTVDGYAQSRGFTYETLVVDDGSTDRTREIARAPYSHDSHKHMTVPYSGGL